MNRKPLFTLLLSLGLAVSPAAMAKSGKHDDDRRERAHERHQRDDHRHHQNRHERHDDRRHDWHHAREHRWHGDRYRVHVYQPPRGYQRHHWRHGDRVPVIYRSNRYVVHDYQAYRLYAPPRNHHWVRVDQDVVLTAITTGLVAAVVYGIFQ